MILHRLPVIHLLPYLRHGSAEIGRKFVEPSVLEVHGGLRDDLEGLFQNFDSLTQDDTRPQWMASFTGR
jgi:hypothetical protein